jgi:hypothetical protein
VNTDDRSVLILDNDLAMKEHNEIISNLKNRLKSKLLFIILIRVKLLHR